jgi:hypothetical protein
MIGFEHYCPPCIALLDARSMQHIERDQQRRAKSPEPSTSKETAGGCHE